MEKKLKDLSFKDIDFSKYKAQIEEIQKQVRNLENDKSLMKKLKKFQEEQKSVFPNVEYNKNLKTVNSSFKKIIEYKDTRKITKNNIDRIPLSGDSSASILPCQGEKKYERKYC